MSAYEEQPVWFDCDGESLLGIVATPCDQASRSGIGVVVIVGGPQYRAGSHRQFTLLARRLAAEGFPTLRFDYRGLGDSTGDARTFLQIKPDIAAATRTLMEQAGVGKVVLWGLCDAASAALLAVDRLQNVAGLVLVNPWASESVGAASVQLKYYYAARIRDGEFWRKLASGKVSPWNSIRSLATRVFSMPGRRQPAAGAAAISFQTLMARGWASFAGPILLALSGNDFTSRQFVDHTRQRREWNGLLEAKRVSRRERSDADHTFSSAATRAWLEQETLIWLRRAVAGHESFDERPESVHT